MRGWHGGAHRGAHAHRLASPLPPCAAATPCHHHLCINQVLKLEGTFSFAAPEYVRIWKGFQKSQLIEATSFKVRHSGAGAAQRHVWPQAGGECCLRPSTLCRNSIECCTCVAQDPVPDPTPGNQTS